MLNSLLKLEHYQYLKQNKRHSQLVNPGFECANFDGLSKPKHTDVNFINILRTNFSYERLFGSFFYLCTCNWRKAAKAMFVQKIRA